MRSAKTSAKKRGKRGSAAAPRPQTVGEEAKGKRAMGGASVRATKGKAPPKDSTSALRSPTPKVMASASVLPPTDDLKTDSPVSARKIKKKKHSAAVEFSAKGSCETAAASQSACDSSSALRPSLKASMTSSVGGDAAATLRLAFQQPPVRRKNRAFLALSELCGGIVKGPIEFMQHVKYRMAAAPSKRPFNLREHIPSYSKFVDCSGPQWEHYAEIMEQKIHLKKIGGAIDYFLEGDYDNEALENFNEIRETIANGSHDEETLAKLVKMVDSGKLQPCYFLNEGFDDKWSPLFTIFFRDVYLPKYGHLLAAVDTRGVQYDALALTKWACHSVAEDCVRSQPGFCNHALERGFQIVLRRTEVKRSLQALSEAEKQQMGFVSAKIIYDKIDDLVAFNAVTYECAVECVADFEPKIAQTL